MATQRGYYREELERATKNIDMALLHLRRVYEAYLEAHPEVSSPVEQVANGLLIGQEILAKIHDSI